MSTYRVVKTITFCYGHRLLRHDGPCRHLHGHSARVEIHITTDQLDHNGLACDFREMKSKVKSWIDAHLDHRMILQEGDPVIAACRELGEPVYVMPTPPSAENLARLIYEQSHGLGLPVSEIRVWESSTSCAMFLRDS